MCAWFMSFNFSVISFWWPESDVFVSPPPLSLPTSVFQMRHQRFQNFFFAADNVSDMSKWVGLIAD